MKKMFLLTLAFSLIVSNVAFAGDGGGKIAFVQTWGSEGVFFATKTRNNDQECGNDAFFLPFSDGTTKSKLALLLNAQALNRDVVILGNNSCDGPFSDREGVTLIGVGD